MLQVSDTRKLILCDLLKKRHKPLLSPNLANYFYLSKFARLGDVAVSPCRV